MNSGVSKPEPIGPAIVTGAASGMGAVVALALAEHDIPVVITDREESGLSKTASAIETVGGQVTVCVADLLDPAAPAQIVAAAVKAYGELRSLVCCAGLLETAPLQGITLESFNRTIGVNLQAPLFLIQAARPHLAPGSAIVCVTSQSAIHPGGFQAAYAASKGGLVTMVQALAAELGPVGIRINGLSPGAADTPMSANAEEEFAYLGEVTPNRRVAQPEDIAAVALFLLSPAADHLHAQNIMVDGGHSRVGAAPPNRSDL